MKIYLFATPGAFGHAENYTGHALCEDGDFLAGHVSSTVEWVQYDLGLTSERKHVGYKEHCRDGYSLEWVDDPYNHPGVTEAYAKHKAKYAPEEATK